MNTITFGKLRELTIADNKKQSQVLVDYFNTFEGDNTFEKFKSILTAWENDVSYTITLNINNIPTKISLSYILSELPSTLNNEIVIQNTDMKLVLDIPQRYVSTNDIIPIYDIIKYINLYGVSINLINLSLYEKSTIINNLPAYSYNLIMNSILNDTTKVVSFNNPLLESCKFNFLTNNPYLFLKGIFSRYTEDYFRDTIYLLSKKIDGQLLLDSTLQDIEYYINRFTEEMNAGTN
jgi:hypothetical protein